MLEHERWDRVFSATRFGDETNRRLVEPGVSAKRVDTSMRLVGDDFCVAARQKQIQTRCCSATRPWPTRAVHPALPETALEDSVHSLEDPVHSLTYSVSPLGRPI